ncbi:MAG: cofactor assembly of complex C subunit B [Cyanobacteriota bacterium ELA615]
MNSKFPLWAGGLGGVLLLLNRLFTTELTNSQSRSDVLGVLLCALLILIGLLWQQIKPKSPDAVVLEGVQALEIYEDLSDQLKLELAWSSHLLLTNTVTKTIVIYYQDVILLRRGILPEKTEFKIGPILERVLQTARPVYLVSLGLYPGRFEFTYLPANTQGVICQPIGEKGVMILGSNVPRSYTKQDENWIAAIAEKINNSLGNDPSF